MDRLPTQSRARRTSASFGLDGLHRDTLSQQTSSQSARRSLLRRRHSMFARQPRLMMPSGEQSSQSTYVNSSIALAAAAEASMITLTGPWADTSTDATTNEITASSPMTVVKKTAQSQWAKVSESVVPGVREDFYLTLLSGISSWTPQPWDSEGEGAKKPLIAWTSLDEVLIASYDMLRRCSPQRIMPAVKMFGLVAHDSITCIAHSRLGLVACGKQSGWISVYDLVNNRSLSDATLQTLAASREITVIQDHNLHLPAADKVSLEATQHCYATSIMWAECAPLAGDGNGAHSDSLSNDNDGPVLDYSRQRIEFIVADSLGRIFKIRLCRDGYLRTLSGIPARLRHRDGISGLAFDAGDCQLAVAGLDNTVSLWVHDATGSTDASILQYKGRIQHFSAVKGLNFCPGTRRLLATGGGRHDRRFRVFDTVTGSVVREEAMPGQIVGIVWLSRWEVFVAIGHSRRNRYWGFGKVYNVATGRVAAEIPGDGYVHSAVKTQGGFCVYTSMNRLIRFTWRDTTQYSVNKVLAACGIIANMPQLR